MAWNSSGGGAGFQYAVSNTLQTATTAKLFWASGTTRANIVPGVPEIIPPYTIPVGAYGLSAVIPVPAANFANPPATATHVLLVLDPDNLVPESDEGNNVAALALCPVGPLTMGRYSNQGYIDSCLVPAMRDALACFEGKVGSQNIRKDSGCRTQLYQDHLREIWEHAKALESLPCIAIVSEGPRQYAVSGSGCTGCQPIIDDLNAEIRDHFNQPEFPSDVARISLHTDGLAVDWKILNMSKSDPRIDEYAESCGLERTVWKKKGTESWHFALAAAQPRQALTFQAHSPVNILVQDPSGRRIGFDPATAAVTNDIGPAATYSGPGTTPQVIQIGPAVVLFGKYLVSGVGTGSGAYTIDVRVDTDDDVVAPVQSILATGTAQAGQPLTPIPPIDCVATTMSLNVAVDSGNVVLRAQPWATNAVVEWTTNLSSGQWNVIPGTFDPVNGLVITNPVAGKRFFRLRSD